MDDQRLWAFVVTYRMKLSRLESTEPFDVTLALHTFIQDEFNSHTEGPKKNCIDRTAGYSD
jgi:hypothetical protein